MMNKSLQNLSHKCFIQFNPSANCSASKSKSAVKKFFITKFLVKWIDDEEDVELDYKCHRTDEQVVNGCALIAFGFQLRDDENNFQNNCEEANEAKHPKRLSHDVVSLRVIKDFCLIYANKFNWIESHIFCSLYQEIADESVNDRNDQQHREMNNFFTNWNIDDEFLSLQSSNVNLTVNEHWVEEKDWSDEV